MVDMMAIHSIYYSEFDESAGIPSFSTISANYSVYHDQGQNSVVDMNITVEFTEDFNSNDLHYLLPLLNMLHIIIQALMVKQNFYM